MFIIKNANTNMQIYFQKLCNHSYQINSNVCLSHLHGHLCMTGISIENIYIQWAQLGLLDIYRMTTILTAC